MFWGAKKIKKYFSNLIEKLHKMAFLIFFFFFWKKFEKVEKTGIITTKFSLRCTPSVILGVIIAFVEFAHKSEKNGNFGFELGPKETHNHNP